MLWTAALLAIAMASACAGPQPESEPGADGLRAVTFNMGWLPQGSMAGVIVAIDSAVGAATASGSPATCLPNNAAVSIYAHRSTRLMLPAPSVPSATLTPAACRRATGHAPLPSLRLERGQ